MRLARYCIAIIFIYASISTSFSQEEDLSALAQEFTQTATNAESRFVSGEELIFSVHVKKFKIGQLDAVTTNTGISFGLESYFSVFDFPIVFDVNERTYKGWFIAEDKQFSLNLVEIDPQNGDLIATVAGEEFLIAKDNYTFIDDMLFVDEQRLSDIFGILHKLQYEKLIITASSSQGLPFLDKISRQNSKFRSNNNQIPSYTSLYRGYEILSPQILDIRLSSIYKEKTKDIQSNYSIQGSRDIALWNSKFSFAGNENEMLNNARINFSRQSIEGELFGNTGITSFEFGDVRDVRQASGQSLAESLGFKFSNTPLLSGIENNVIVLDGDVPTGWDVELYRNNVLLRQIFNEESGRYNFLDVPLLFGQNSFEIILYGPQGQVRRETINRLLDESTFSTKSFTYAVSLTDTTRSLIPSTLSRNRSVRDNGFNFSSRGSFYLGQSTALDFGVKSQFGGDFDNSIFNIGVNSLLSNTLLVNGFLEYSNDKVLNLQSSARTTAYGQSLSLQASVSDATEEKTSRTTLLTAGIDGDIKLGEYFSLPLNQQFSYTENANGSIFSYLNKIGYRIGGIGLFNNFNYSKEKFANGGEEESSTGTFNVQANIKRVFTRVGLSYSFDLDDPLLSANASVNWNINKKYRANFAYSKDFVQDLDFVSAQLSYFGDMFELSSRIGYSDLTGYDVGVNASFSLAGQKRELNSVNQSALPQASSGTLSVRVFFDKNLNAVFDANDILLPNVEVKALQFHKSAITNEQGIANLTRLSNMRTSDITVDRNTLPDPFLRPRLEGVSITARAGLADFLDFPIVPASEVTGMLEFVDKGQFLPGARVKLNLYDINNQLVFTTKTEYDGFYAFTDVMPGQYYVKIDEESIQRFDLIDAEFEPIQVEFMPDVITYDIKVNKTPYSEFYVSELASLSKNKFIRIAYPALKRKFDDLGVKFSVVQDHKNGTYFFYALMSDKKSSAESACSRLNSNNIQCKVSVITVFDET